MSSLPFAICLMGPTASGKTDLAIELSKRLPVDIISVDSALIYKNMDIGTAKPTRDELRQAPHRLIDILEPTESYSVARFYHDALEEMRSITARGRIPLLVGGTMMYFRVLREGIASMPSADPQVRAEINALAEEKGWSHIHSLLAEIDVEAAARIKPTDPQRLQRALEVYRVSGKTLTQHWVEQRGVEKIIGDATGKAAEEGYTNGVESSGSVIEPSLPPVPYRLLSIAIAPSDRKVLHQRIERRFELMLDAGFQQEVESLMGRGDLNLELPSMRCVGYRQMWEYLDGSYDFDTMKYKGVVATRQLAKRQLTWLRSWKDLSWLESLDENNLSKVLNFYNEAASNP